MYFDLNLMGGMYEQIDMIIRYLTYWYDDDDDDDDIKIVLLVTI